MSSGRTSSQAAQAQGLGTRARCESRDMEWHVGHGLVAGGGWVVEVTRWQCCIGTEKRARAECLVTGQRTPDGFKWVCGCVSRWVGTFLA